MSKLLLVLGLVAVLFALETLASSNTAAVNTNFQFGSGYSCGGKPYEFNFAEPSRPITGVKTQAGVVIKQGGASSATTTGYNGAPKGQQYPLPPY